MTALDMAKTNQNGIFSSFWGMIDFENLLMLKKAAWKPSTRTKYFFFYLLLVKLGGLQKLGGVGNFQNFNKLGASNKLKCGEKIKKSVIDPSLQLETGE